VKKIKKQKKSETGKKGTAKFYLAVRRWRLLAFSAGCLVKKALFNAGEWTLEASL